MPRVSPDRLEARRGQILAASRRAFARHGYEGATVKVLEAETGLSRGAIFHHFRDKEALFLALAQDDAARTAARVAEAGLVQVMRELGSKDAGWLGVQLEVRRRLRTDPAFAASWAERQESVAHATAERLERQRTAGVVRDDVPVALLADFLRLVLDGLVTALAAGMAPEHLPGVLDLVEDAVRRPRQDDSEDAVRPPAHSHVTRAPVLSARTDSVPPVPPTAQEAPYGQHR